jgi:cell division protein FtsB
MRAKKKTIRGGDRAIHRRPPKYVSRTGLLIATWRRWAAIRAQRLRLLPLVKKVESYLPVPREPRSLYDLVASLQPPTRRCLIGVLSFGIFLLSIWLFIFAPRGLVTRTSLSEMIASSVAMNEAIIAKNQALREEIARLDGDAETIEAMARNELNMAFPNESIYRPREEGPPAYVMNVRPMTETMR